MTSMRLLRRTFALALVIAPAAACGGKDKPVSP